MFRLSIQLVLLLSLAFTLAIASSTTEPLYDNATATLNEQHLLEIQENPNHWTGLMVGDSITAMLNRSDYGETLRSKGVFISGIGGNRVEQALARIENGLLNEKDFCPKNILLAIGTNNLIGKNNTPADIVNGIDHLANKCLSLCPRIKVHVLSVLPRSAPAPLIDEVILDVNQGLLNRFRFRNSRKIAFHDVTNVFQIFNQTLNRVHINPSLYIYDGIYDGIHIGPDGQAKLLPFLLSIFKV